MWENNVIYLTLCAPPEPDRLPRHQGDVDQHLRAGGEEQPGTVLFAAEFSQQRAVDGGAVKHLDYRGAADVVGVLSLAVADVKLLPSKVP